MLWFKRREAVGLLWLATLAPAACSDGDVVSSAPDAESDGAVNSGGTGGGGPGSGGAGGTMMGTGGDLAGGSGGFGDTDGGSAAGSGGNGGITGGGAAGTAGAGPDGDADAGPGPLTVCDRLTTPAPLSYDVTMAFEHAVFIDCRVKWITRLYLDLDQRAQFLNGMLAWNLEFWGCRGTVTKEFALLYKPARLTPADANAIIEHYIDAATVSLAMSPGEVQEMRAALRVLAQPNIDAGAQGFSKSACPDGGNADGAAADGAGDDAASTDEEGGSVR
jgi:hypothetical protein